MCIPTSTSTQCQECIQKSIPVVKNVKKFFRECEGYASFKEWFNTENNIYIGRNAAKYTKKDVPESKWVNPYLVSQWKGPSEEWILEDIMKTYENYVRNTPLLMESLHELKGKELGCWCKPKQCHGDILVKLYKEFCEE